MESCRTAPAFPRLRFPVASPRPPIRRLQVFPSASNFWDRTGVSQCSSSSLMVSSRLPRSGGLRRAHRRFLVDASKVSVSNPLARFARAEGVRSHRILTRTRLLRLANELLNPRQECDACGFQNFHFVAFYNLYLVFLGPIAKIGDVGTIPKIRAEAAAPTDKIFP